MICPNCGTENAETARFCGKCGQEFSLKVSPQPQQPVQHHKPKRFVRCADDKQLGGVCSGFAKYFDMDVGLVRVLAIVSIFFTGVTPIAYLIAWLALPEEVCSQ